MSLANAQLIPLHPSEAKNESTSKRLFSTQQIFYSANPFLHLYRLYTDMAASQSHRQRKKEDRNGFIRLHK